MKVFRSLQRSLIKSFLRLLSGSSSRANHKRSIPTSAPRPIPKATPAPTPSNEVERLKALHRYDILDTSPEVGFDDLTALASYICGTPIALVSLVDANRQWFKSKVGLDATETPRELAFCAHAILSPAEPLIVPNVLKDERFATNPLVLSDPNIRFYAGVPLVTPDNFPLGTLCVIDRIPRDLRSEQIEALRALGRQVMTQMELRRALEKEKELNELKSRFVSMTSHEFRTPLTTILGSAELLEHYGHKWPEEKKRRHTQRIQNTVQHMTQLLNDVLLLGKAESGKLEFNPHPLDVEQFCLNLIEELELLDDSEPHRLNFVNHTQNLKASLDEKLLRHILNNLLSNAIKYSPTGSIVKFELFCQNDQAIFQIQDQGIGIPEEDQQYLFESFHRAKNVGNIPGTGLGLAIVKKSVDLHEGNITVNSEVGVGTTFIVTIPLSQERETEHVSNS
jgi:signal transduction histidine kinase